MRSDAILKLFSVYSLSSVEPIDHVALRFAEHLSHRYHDISSAELAFFLRVGGQLVRQKMEDLWNAAETPESDASFVAQQSKGNRNIASDSALLRGGYSGTNDAMNDERYASMRHSPALHLDNLHLGGVSRLRRVSTDVDTPRNDSAAVACPLGQNARWIKMAPPQLHSAIENEIARSQEIVASSKELIARSKELRAAITLSRASRAASAEKAAAKPEGVDNWNGQIRLLQGARSWS